VTIFLILRPSPTAPTGNNNSIGSRRNAKNFGTYHRLVLGMSFCCLSSSIAWFFTTWPIPRDTPDVYGAVGTRGTCTAQGFFAQFSISSVMYNASLSVYYVLVIVYGWSERRIVKIEPYIHLHAISWGLGTGLASIGLTLFNQVGWDCWISAYPIGCTESWKNDGVATTCTRGDNGSIYQWAFYYAPLWIVIVVVMLLMRSVYMTIRRQEIVMERHQSILNDDRERLKKSRQIAIQAGYFVGAFYVTWFFPTIFELVLVTSGKVYFALLFLTAFFVPIQGLLNLIVFVRPKYGRYVRNNPDQSYFLAWFRMLWEELGGRVNGSSGPAATSSRRSSRQSSTKEISAHKGTGVSSASATADKLEHCQKTALNHDNT
jgi:hypothetical protein